MGIVLILLGLAAAGVIADFVVENGLASGPNQNFQLFGGSFHESLTRLVLGTGVAGALAVTLLVLGISLLRGSWGRRRGLKQRVSNLEKENVELRSRANLAAAVGEKPIEEPWTDTGPQN